MGVIGFEDKASFRLKDLEKKKVLKVWRRNQDLFENPSHFFRVAVIKELRKYDEKGRRIKGDRAEFD